MLKRWCMLSGFILFILFLTACSSPMDSSERGIQQEVTVTAENIPDELEKEDIEANITASPNNQIDSIIGANFPLIDVVSDDSTSAEIYATTKFSLEELASLITSKAEPEETSEIVDEQQIFIYPDYFVTLKPSVDDASVLLIEVANEAFVERNYSPSFLQTYFGIRLLESIFGNNWGSRSCQTGACYGGYTGKQQGYGTTNRGNTTFRGGGPNAGK
ncbi:DUF4247 domain-containing protein [Oceanobacillus chungangensis]|uniref:DUF4247 domain-containing protein n=1 Tax=Oceanobacillus chungangensis TaxID=1229152 RepID=A0A3D8Q1S4_9BACI|nr:DUF4247 domain-containing protein [Oceanobacillus chungangensis]RDW21558.1 DUF4247 domain-containing protein [Oceanobacillus chungangensis]